MMGPGGWVVGVFLRFSSNGSATMTRLGSQTQAANLQLARQQGLIDKNAFAMANYQRKMEALRLTQLRMVTVGAGVATAVGIGVMATAANDAAKLQIAMIGIQNATGANAAQTERLRGIAFDVSAATAQSVIDSANVMKVMATSGINDPNQLAKIAMPAAKFADVQYLSRGVPFEQGAKQAIQAAHLFQQYGGPGLAHMFDQLTKLSFMMPDDLNRYITQAGYYMPVFRRLGVSDDQALVAGAFMDRMGLGRGKGGTGLQNFVLQQMQALAITEHVQAGRRGALDRLGLLNADGSSKYYNVNRAKYGDDKAHFDVFGSLNAINDAVQRRTKGLSGQSLAKAQGEAIIDIQKALNVQGGRIGFLGTPEAINQLNSMLKQLPKLPGTDKAQGNYMNSLAGQFKLAMTNFQSLMTELGWPWLTDLTKFFHGLGEVFHGAQKWLHENREMGKAIGAIFAGLTAISAAVFVGGSFSLIAAGMEALGVALPTFGGLLAALASPALVAVAAIAAAYLVFNRSTDIAWLFGRMARFMHDKGWPGLEKAFGTGWNALMENVRSKILGGFVFLAAALNDPIGTARALLSKEKNAFGAGYNSGGAAPGGTTHIHHVEVHVHAATDPVKTAKKVAEVLRDPRSMMGTNSSTSRTHWAIPKALSVPTG